MEITSSKPTPEIRVFAGSVLEQHALADGTTLILHLSRSSRGNRQWVIGRTLRVLRIQPGAVYKTSRSKGVNVLWAREYDERSVRASDSARSSGEQVYLETLARARDEAARQIAADIVAAL